MRALIQRVACASVVVDENTIASIDAGFLVFLGVTHTDTEREANTLARKIAGLRLFEDDTGKMNRDLNQAGGTVLVVSQFTLYADASRGRRPSFSAAAPPTRAEPLYGDFCRELERLGTRVERGRFQAHMAVKSTNDGPVTLWLDTADMVH